MSDPLAVRLRSGFSTTTEQLQAAQLIDSLVGENGTLVAGLQRIACETTDSVTRADANAILGQD